MKPGATDRRTHTNGWGWGVMVAAMLVLLVLVALVVLGRNAPPAAAAAVPDISHRADVAAEPAGETEPSPEVASTGREAGAALDELDRQMDGAADAAPAQIDDDAAAIERWEQRLASSLAARREAEQGDLLTPEFVEHLRHRTRVLVEGDNGDRILASIREADPTRDGDGRSPLLAVNAQYPEDEPLTMVPPRLLAAYPRLPEGVEYRFVGCRLILLERDASLILDYTEECFL